MLQPYKIDMYVYAESQDDAARLEHALKAFVSGQRERGVAVTAQKLCALLAQWGNNPIITNFLH